MRSIAATMTLSMMATSILGFVTGGVAAQPLRSLSTALEEQMDLKLEDTKNSVDVWVIESVAKPNYHSSQNATS
jgi:hypothetical protein